jgi:WD40 repeat protein
MKRCVYCQGEFDPATRRCRECQRTQPSASIVQEAKPSLPRRVSRRTVLLGLAGLGLAGGVAARIAYVLARVQSLYTYRSPDGMIETLAWSPDSQLISSSTSGADLQVWEALSGRQIQTLPDRAGVESVAWSPDGRYIATGSWDRTASIWEFAIGKRVLIYRGHIQGQSSTRFHQQSVIEMLPEIAARELHRSVSLRPWGITSLTWSPDGTRLLSSGGDNTTQVWEALTGQPLLTFGSQLDYYYAATWSPDGQHLLMRTSQGVQIHNATTGVHEFTIPIQDDLLNGPSAYSPDGKYLATAPINDQGMHLWDVASGRQVRTYQGHSDGAWSPDSKRLASIESDLGIEIWDVSSGQTEFTYRGHMNLLQQFFSEVAPPVAAEGSLMRQSTASAPEDLRSSQLLPQDTSSPSAGITALAWAPNGRFIASGGTDATIQVWQPG